MKEAAGEANMTVITIVLIAIVLGVGTVIVNNVMNNTAKSAACQTAGGYWEGGKCAKTKGGSSYLTCKKATVANAAQGIAKGDWTCTK